MMNPIKRVLLADDEEGMRLILKKAIKRIEGFEIVGEAEDGEAVLSLFQEAKPEVIFLDVEMPKIDGVECARRIIEVNPKTIIIFATAHAEYMVDAFKYYAFDYLVKPFMIERVFQTLERIKALDLPLDHNTLRKHSLPDKGMQKILIKNKDGISFLDMKDIVLIERENKSTVLHTIEDSYSTSESLSELYERLDEELFFRCHKSYIINLSMILKISPYGRWTYIVKLKNTSKDALITSEKYEELKKMFDK